MALIDDLIAKFQEAQDRARVANETRYQQGLELFDRVIKQYETGGTFEKATEAKIGRAGEKSVASGMQALVSSGLAGTSIAAGLGKKFEEEVGQPTRLEAQDIAAQRTAQALEKKAGFIERREDVGPDFATIAGLAQTIGAEGQPGTGGPTDPSRVTGTATPLGDIGTTTITSPQLGRFTTGTGRGGGRTRQTPKSSTSQKRRAAPRGRGGGMPGQGRGTFFMAPPKKAEPQVDEPGFVGPPDPFRTPEQRLALGQGPVTKKSAQEFSRKAPKKSLMQQADPFNISGRFS